MPDRELLLEQLERLAIVLDELMPQCAELVRDAIALLKEQEAVECPTDHDNELTRHVLFIARQHVEECLNKARVRYGGETAEFLMFAKGIRDACWAIDELISTHNEGTEQNDE